MTISNLMGRIDNVVDRFGTDTIKRKIGDSTNNNRVVTVSQLTRFLRRSKSTNYKALGRRLTTVKELLTNALRNNRSWNRRTDAYDVNELLMSLNDVYFNALGSELKSNVEAVING